MAFQPEVKNPYSPMNIPLTSNLVDNDDNADKDENADFEFVVAGDMLEPESENSPRGNTRAGVIPSFTSSVSDRDYPQYVGALVPTRGPRETTSWNSAATDFDDLTSPGARAEHNDEYREAVYGSRNGMGAGAPFRVPGAPAMPYFNAPGWSAPNGTMHPPFISHGGSAAGLQAQAEELDRAAEQLMAAAMQAKAAASQIKGQSSTAHVPAGRGATIASEKSRWGFLGLKSKSKAPSPPFESDRTTIMLRNLPNDYTRDMLLELLDANNLVGSYDFVYLPTDFKRRAGLGYAFVNLVTHAEAQRAFATLQGFSAWQFCSSKVLEVAWGEPLQGLAAHIDRYRNSPVMHDDVPDEFRPLLFQGGFRVPFPQPTKRIQKPRMKSCRSSEAE